MANKFSNYSNNATPANLDILLFENAAANDSFNTTFAQLKTALGSPSVPLNEIVFGTGTGITSTSEFTYTAGSLLDVVGSGRFKGSGSKYVEITSMLGSATLSLNRSDTGATYSSLIKLGDSISTNKWDIGMQIGSNNIDFKWQTTPTPIMRIDGQNKKVAINYSGIISSDFLVNKVSSLTNTIEVRNTGTGVAKLLAQSTGGNAELRLNRAGGTARSSLVKFGSPIDVEWQMGMESNTEDFSIKQQITGQHTFIIKRVNELASTSNIGFYNASFGNGVGVLSLGNANTVPTANPAGGGIIYCEAGALKYRGTSGTITTLGNA